MALHCLMTYQGNNESADGRPDPWYHYLVIAKPGEKPGTGVASIISLTDARAMAIAQSPSHTIDPTEGGTNAALKNAEEFLDRKHPGLKKFVSDIRS